MSAANLTTCIMTKLIFQRIKVDKVSNVEFKRPYLGRDFGIRIKDGRKTCASEEVRCGNSFYSS